MSCSASEGQHSHNQGSGRGKLVVIFHGHLEGVDERGECGEGSEKCTLKEWRVVRSERGRGDGRVDSGGSSGERRLWSGERVEGSGEVEEESG